MPTAVIPSVPAAFSQDYYEGTFTRYMVAPVTFDLRAIPAGSLLNGISYQSAGIHYHTNLCVYSANDSIRIAPTGQGGIGTTNFVSFGAGIQTKPFGGGSAVFSAPNAFAVSVQSRFGTVATMEALTSDSGVATLPNTFPYDTADWTLCQLTIDYTPIAVPFANPRSIDPQVHRGNVTISTRGVNYPTGYARGRDLSDILPVPAGKYYDIVNTRGGYLATVVGNVLRIYDATGTELTNGAACAGVDICRMMYRSS